MQYTKLNKKKARTIISFCLSISFLIAFQQKCFAILSDQEFLDHRLLECIVNYRGKLCVEEKLRSGANPNAQSLGNTALMIAIQYYDKDIISLLIEKGAKLDNQNNLGITALIVAIEKDKNFVVKRLLEKGADPNLTDKDGSTPLLYAAKHGTLEIINELLDKDADPNLANNEGLTALMRASQNAYIDIVKKLLEEDADPNKESNQELTALIIAMNKKSKESDNSGVYDKIVSILIKNKAYYGIEQARLIYNLNLFVEKYNEVAVSYSDAFVSKLNPTSGFVKKMH